MMLRRRAGGLPDIRRDGEEEDREGVDEGGELGEERVREHEDNGGGGGGEYGGQIDSESENNGGGVEGDNSQTEQLENCDSLVARESNQSLEMPLNGMNNGLGGDVTNESNDSRTEHLAARDITENEEDNPLINSIGEEEADFSLINSIGEENVHASIGHMAELMEEEEEEEIPLIIAEDEGMEENASFEGVDSNREEPIVCQGMASDEEGNVAAVTFTERSEENEEEELTVLS